MANGAIADFLAQNFDVIWAVAAVIGSFIIARLINFSLKHYAVKLTAKTKTDLDDMIITAMRTPITLGFLFFGLYYAFTTVEYLLPHAPIVNQVFSIIQVYFAAFVIARLINTFLQWYAKNVAVKTESKLDDHFLPALKKVVYIAAFLLGSVFIMGQLGMEVTTLIATLGIGGLAIALALQDTLSNFFAGAYTTVEKPIRIGDFIEIEGGDRGFVNEIGWRTTRIRKTDNTMLIIPNSKFAQSKVVNFDLPSESTRLTVSCGVSYESDLEKVERVAIDVAKEIMAKRGITEFIDDAPEMDQGAPPYVRFCEFGDSNINFTVTLRVKKPTDMGNTRHMFIKDLKKRFDQEGIEISWPVRKLYMVKEKEKKRSGK